LFDLALIRDQAKADCKFTNHHTALKSGVLLDVWNLSYYSYESIDGKLNPILIRAFAARPASFSGKLPGIVQAHGLGGFAKEANATGPAALLKMFVIAYTGPGGGDAPDNTSEGRPAGYDNGYRMFDTVKDLRGSWFWGHSVAAMRALTCLQTRTEVDPDRLGITGFSAGGVASLIVAGADDRVKAAVPLSGVLAWDVACASPDAWEHGLMKQAGVTEQSQEWVNLMNMVDPAKALGTTPAKVLVIDGSTDEFFPLTAMVATFEAIPGLDKRVSVSANFDHGCYKVSAIEKPEDIEKRAALHAEGGQKFWFNHWFGTDPAFSYLPAAPVAEVTPAGATILAKALVDDGNGKYKVEEVRLWASNDNDFTFLSEKLDPQGGGLYAKVIVFPLQTNTTYFVDVQYKTNKPLFPDRFTISSTPAIPETLIPHIRKSDTCL
jgi:cephalosporin-C deacetylase-like acetyl esterase